jgi:S-adenosylmethionine:tRNA ribosyltransferase-isomerase
MLVLDRKTTTFHDDWFANLPNYLVAGDCLVLNNTKVFRARLHGRRNGPDGASVELFLLRKITEDGATWQALARPAKRVQPGDSILISDDLRAEVIQGGERGERTFRFQTSASSVDAALERVGKVPLPPYIHRDADERDESRYQTVFARESGSVAAPTAGLHFTDAILRGCQDSGAAIAEITLHVGLGTFKALDEDQPLADVQLHGEQFSIEDESLRSIESARRRVCIGTTSVRALESALSTGRKQGETNLFISPGFSFRGTNALLTNFHLPASSLLILVCAFAGVDFTMAAYRHAVSARYRFFSYGDCMLIL